MSLLKHNCSILSWNINGLRSNKRDLKELLDSLDSSIICLQETKITRDVLEEPLAIVEGYSSYFSFSKKRSGYSGVATFCKDNVAPTHCQEGLSGLLGENLMNGGGNTSSLPGSWDHDDLKELDKEGRTIITQHLFMNESQKYETVTIINVYCPRADYENIERNLYKMKFMELLRQRASAIRKSGSYVIILGDINISHKRIDHCDPEDSEKNCGKAFEDRPGRKFLDSLIWDTSSDFEANSIQPTLDTSKEVTIDSLDDYSVPNYTNFQVIDSFRYLYPDVEKAFTCWNTFVNARSTNYGTRIDYILVDKEFICNVKDSTVEQDIMGSDHCPVKLVTSLNIASAESLPALCTKFYPEFQGKQSKIKTFFNKTLDKTTTESNSLKHENQLNTLSKTIKRKSETAINESSKNVSKSKQVKLSQFFVSKKKDQPKNELVASVPDICISEKEKEMETPDNQLKIESIIKKRSNVENKCGWNFLMKAPQPAPMCPGHGEPCSLRTVRKKGPNFNKQFYACSRGAGKEGDPNAQCNFFKWFSK